MIGRALLLCGLCLGGLHASPVRAQVQQLPPGTTLPADDAPKKTPADSALHGAEEKMSAGDCSSAVALLQPLTDRAHPSTQALYDLGFCKESLDDTAAAIAAYTRAIDSDAGAVLPRVALGLLQARSNNVAAAEPLLAAAVALKDDGAADVKPARAQAYRALARIHLPTAPDRSRDELLLALRLSPEQTADIQLSGEIAEAMHDDSAAEQAYTRVLGAAPPTAQAVAQLARVQQRRNELDQAHTTLDAGLKQSPHDAVLLSEQASLLLHRKNVAAAIPILLQLHQSRPDEAASTRLLARAYVAQGQPTLAEPLFQQLAQASPADGDLQVEWADSLIRQKRNAEAEALLEKALTAGFSTPASHARAAEELAFAASNNHDPQTVVRAMSIRSTILPLDATCAFLLATAHDTLHQSREAAGYYCQFLQLADGNFPDEVWQAQQRLATLSRAK